MTTKTEPSMMELLESVRDALIRRDQEVEQNDIRLLIDGVAAASRQAGYRGQDRHRYAQPY